MKNINIAQTILIGISIVAIVAAVVMFALFRGGSSGPSNGITVMWGTIPQDVFGTVLMDLANYATEIEGLEYVEKNPETIEKELLTAMAEGNGPDLVLLNEKQIISNQKRLQTIPFESYPLRNFQETFVEESSLLVSRDGLIGIPFLIDPLILYYNKNILSNAGFSKPPQTWTEILALAPELTQKDSSFNISKSTIALGSFDNINNAKNIFWMLVLQAGNPVIERDIDPEKQIEIYKSLFNENLNFTLNPTYAATNFFTQFSNPTKTIYSWNRSLPNSQTSFISGDLAFYIGKASELSTIRRINPNLNFDITLVPQSQSSIKKITYGEMYTLVIPRTARNLRGATATITSLTSQDAQTRFAKELGIASVRKDLLSVSDAASSYESIINRSAIIAQGILEPDTKKTSDIIKELIDTIVSGQYEVSVAISRADEKLKLLLSNE